MMASSGKTPTQGANKPALSPSDRPTTAQSAVSVQSSGSPYLGDYSSVSSTRRYEPIADAGIGKVSDIFLFVNPTSGGNAAASFTQAGLTAFRLADPEVELHVADIRDGPSGDKPAFKALKTRIESLTERHQQGKEKESIIVVMCGGDGTVLWGIMEIWEHQIPCDDIIVTVIPYGTGNDFAKSLGWDSLNALNPFANDMVRLKSLIEEWMDSPMVHHDVWDIVFELHPGGQFQKIDSKTRKKVAITGDDGQHMLVLCKKLTNYFSVGIESRIGIGFDRHRKTSSIRNKIVYMNEGVKKAFFHKGVHLTHILEELSVGEEGQSQEVVFNTNSSDTEHNHLRGCGSIIASNIPSFASGLNIWKNARRIGLLDPKGSRITENSDDAQHLLERQQRMGDGQLEWVSFGGITALGSEQVVEGFGRRIHQGGGPYFLRFNSDLGSSERVYFQVDGEFYQMTKPKVVKIQMFRKITCLARKEHQSVKFI